MPKKFKFKNFEVNKLLDIMYDPCKDKYSYLEINGRRKEMTKTEFLNVLQYYLKERIICLKENE